MIKALFFDIDGTLVSFKTHVIPQPTVDALRQAKQRGVGIYISTGRAVPFIINLGQISDLIDGYITSNGAMCVVGKEEFGMHVMLHEDVERILRACDRYGKPCFVVGTAGIAVYHLTPLVVEKFGKILGLTEFDFADIDETLRSPILQMTPFFSPEEEAEVKPTLQACYSGRWTAAFTDITHVDADKGRGLIAIAEHEHLTLDETMAFGDGGNDIPIIQRAGIGVAMGNATPDVKAAADYTTTSVDDEGVPRALRHFGVI